MPVSDAFSVLWVLFQPVLFGLIGAEVDIEALQPKTVGRMRFFSLRFQYFLL
jgi:hypothetical protein